MLNGNAKIDTQAYRNVEQSYYLCQLDSYEKVILVNVSIKSVKYA